MFTNGLEKLNFFSENDLPIYNDKNNIKFLMFGETCEFRVRTMYTKEPETIKWINAMEQDSIFYDIGANIGIYSIYAASRWIKRTYSFEPSVSNNYILGRNITLNNFESKIVNCNFAISAKNGYTFFDKNEAVGSGNNQIAVSGNYVCGQSTLKELIDSSIFEFPNYIKIDIDGFDFDVLVSAGHHLNDSRLKSVLIEVDETDCNYSNQVINFMANCSFPHVEKRHYPDFDNYYYRPVFNYIFRR
jgi:FkbM family methyltransferase